MSKLAGKTALITGASRGIGAGIARRLASDGANVAITYNASPDKAAALVTEIESAGGHALAIQADSADSAAVKQAVRATVDTYGSLDILVNNAGIVSLAQIGEIPEAEFDRAFYINVRSAFIATQEAVRHMREGGRIIMLGSINSDFIPFAGASVYSMTKAAIAGFTRGLARDLGPRGITVNNIQPGPVDTDMNPADGPLSELIKGFIAVQRYGKTSEIAALVAFLASPEAAYITGAQIKIDGGTSA